MKILVRKKGYGFIKPLDDIARWFHGKHGLEENPIWIEAHRNPILVEAVDFLDRHLEVGEYEAKLVFQYQSINNKLWFTTHDIKGDIRKDIPIRLVFVKEYSKGIGGEPKEISKSKCKICRVGLYVNELQDGLCSYCKTAKEGTKIIQKVYTKTAIL